jgi:hypothetical protein
VDELFTNFHEELCVAESIDMFHLSPDDWDSDDLAVFTIAYVALLYRHVFAAEADQELIVRAIDLEAQRASERRRAPEQADNDLAARIEHLFDDWHASSAAGRGETPFARTADAIRFACRHLVKPASRAKAENLALMPFLQIYLPERASGLRRLASGIQR